MYWLVLAYLFHTLGELCASPVILSYITKLSPKKFVASVMGLFRYNWFRKQISWYNW